MAVLTYSDIPLESKEGHARGVLRRFFDRIIEAREVQAKRYVARYLLQLDDEALKHAGFTREELLKNASMRYF